MKEGGNEKEEGAVHLSTEPTKDAKIINTDKSKDVKTELLKD
jgi:hypothetical protein